MGEKGTKSVGLVRKASARGARYRQLSIVVPTKAVQELLIEKEVLEREIALKQRHLASIHKQLRAAGFLVRDDLPSRYDDARPLAPTKRLSLIDAIEKLANESAHPISKAELRRGLVAMGLPLENFNNYFYQAIRRLRSARRISVLKDGSVWRP